MKITIAYLPEEADTAAVTLADIQRNNPEVKVHKSGRHPPFMHIYLTTTLPANHCYIK